MEFTFTKPDVGPIHILVIFDGVPYEADSTHPWFAEIVDLVCHDDPRALDLFPICSVQQPSEHIVESVDDPPPDGYASWGDYYAEEDYLAEQEELGEIPDVQARAEVDAHLNRPGVGNVSYSLLSEKDVSKLMHEHASFRTILEGLGYNLDHE